MYQNTEIRIGSGRESDVLRSLVIGMKTYMTQLVSDEHTPIDSLELIVGYIYIFWKTSTRQGPNSSFVT